MTASPPNPISIPHPLPLPRPSRPGPATRRPTRRTALAAALLLALAAAAPNPGPDNPVVARSGGLRVTAARLHGLLAGLPAATRAKIAADPAALAELLRADLLQSALLAEARAKGWDRKPEVAAEAERARDAVIVRAYLASQVPPPPPLTDAALQAAYQASKSRFMLPRQFHLAQIFLAVPATASPAQAEQQRLRAVALRRQCAGNPDLFAATAKRLSDDTRSAAAGDLGWIGQNQLVEPIRTALLGLSEGATTEPLRTADGWHLIELLATRPAGPAPLDQVRPALQQALADQQRQTQTTAYLDAMLRRSAVEVDEAQLARFAKPQPTPNAPP